MPAAEAFPTSARFFPRYRYATVYALPRNPTGLLVDGVTPKDVRAAAAATGSDPVSLPLASMCVNITSEAAYNTSAWVGVDLGAVLMVRYVKVSEWMGDAGVSGTQHSIPMGRPAWGI